jgi:hypothetical protein
MEFNQSEFKKGIILLELQYEVSLQNVSPTNADNKKERLTGIDNLSPDLQQEIIKLFNRCCFTF